MICADAIAAARLGVALPNLGAVAFRCPGACPRPVTQGRAAHGLTTKQVSDADSCISSLRAMPFYERSEQRVWTDEDFDVMGWHDATVHALAFESTTLLLDLDYTLGDDCEADSEEQRSKMPSFWMSPATLVFAAVDDIEGRVGGELAGLFGAPTSPAPTPRRRIRRRAPHAATVDNTLGTPGARLDQAIRA